MNLVRQLIEKVSRSRKRIVVVGDAMVDEWAYGKLLPCQDGCDKFVEGKSFEDRRHRRPGGAGNAERSISLWSNVDTSLYSYPQNERGLKRRLVDSETSKIVMRVDRDADPQRSALFGWARDMALEMIQCAHAVLISDYDKGFLLPEFITSVVDLCKKRDIPCVADAKRQRELYQGTIVKCNSAYAESLLWIDLTDKYIVTRGATGPLVSERGVVARFYNNLPDGPSVECVNHVGAGDCFAAHLTLALAHGFSLKDAAAIAHSAGRVYVQHPHNEPPRPVQVEADMQLFEKSESAAAS